MKFVGSYPKYIKTALIASAVSGHNGMLISPPGWGKTDMARQTAQAIAGDDGMIWIPLDPATPPEIIKGAYDPAQLLNGKLERIVTGTPYDPAARIIIADEVWRANDVVFDALVHVTSRKDLTDQDTRPVFWGTANFIGKAERTEALRDRFALWLHLDPDLDVKDIVSAHLNNGTGVDKDWNIGLPTWEDCIATRKSRPTARTLQLIQDYIETLASEAQVQNFAINPRRIVQWAEIIFRVGVWYSQTTDWQAIPAQALEPLKWAYPTTDKTTARKWEQVAGSVTDALGAAIEGIKAEAYGKFLEVSKISDISQRTGQVTQLGRYLSQIQSDLCRLVGVDQSALSTLNDPNNALRVRDPRIPETLNQLAQWFAAAVSGQQLK